MPAPTPRSTTSTGNPGTKGTGDSVPSCGDALARIHNLGQNPPSLLSQAALLAGKKRYNLATAASSEGAGKQYIPSTRALHTA